MNKNKNTDNITISDITLKQFGDYTSGFLQSLADRGYAAGTIGQHRCFIDALAGTMHAKGISIEELDEALTVDLRRKPAGKRAAGLTLSLLPGVSCGICRSTVPGNRHHRPRPRKSRGRN